MPIYEFRCRQCDHRFEMLRPVKDPGVGIACPECGADRPEKLLSVFASPAGSRAETGSTTRGCGGGGFG
jgi:putative FmdB family regulatory protein